MTQNVSIPTYIQKMIHRSKTARIIFVRVSRKTCAITLVQQVYVYSESFFYFSSELGCCVSCVILVKQSFKVQNKTANLEFISFFNTKTIFLLGT